MPLNFHGARSGFSTAALVRSPEQPTGTEQTPSTTAQPGPSPYAETPAGSSRRGSTAVTPVTRVSPTASTLLNHKALTRPNAPDLDHVDARRRFLRHDQRPPRMVVASPPPAPRPPSPRHHEAGRPRLQRALRHQAPSPHAHAATGPRDSSPHTPREPEQICHPPPPWRRRSPAPPASGSPARDRPLQHRPHQCNEQCQHQTGTQVHCGSKKGPSFCSGRERRRVCAVRTSPGSSRTPPGVTGSR